MISRSEDLSPREREQMQYDLTMFDKQAVHTKAIKQLESDVRLAEIKGRLEASRLARESNELIREHELELARLEARWLSWLRIPITIVKLPFLVIMACAYCIAVARKYEPSENFWKLLKG